MTRSFILIGAATLILSGAANAQLIGPSPAGSDRAARDFITQAAQSDEFERREGRLAERRASNPQVRAFAAEMVSAHTKTTAALKQAIRRAHMAPPPPPNLTGDQSGMMNQLKSLRGRAFDKAYIDQQVQAHQNALQLMNGYAQGGAPGPIRNAAQSATPIVQHHLDMAEAIAAHIGG